MKAYRLLQLLLSAAGITFITMVNAVAQTSVKEQTNSGTASNTAPNELRTAQASPQALTAAEAKAKREAQLAARQKLLANATALIKAGKANEAYALMSPYQSIMAGDYEYDYLLGLAAIDSGRPNEAIFALERVLAVNPNHLQARAEIARAYLATGELAASRQEFETVQKQNPPKEVNATIQKYLDIIETERSDKTTTFRAYVEATLGDDSNVNSATSSRQIPMLGGVWLLDANGVAKHDSFGSLAAGFNVRHLLTPEWALIGGGNIGQRSNSKEHNFDTSNIDGNVGVSLTQGDDSYSAVLQAQSFLLDSKTYRDAVGVAGQWQRNLDNNSQGSVYLQYTNLTYPGQTARNADRYVAGVAYATTLSGEYTPVVYVSLYAGTESPQKSGLSNLSNTLYGIRAGGEMKLTPQTTLLASAGVENRDHDGKDPLSSTVRKDTQADLRLAVAYVPVQKWTITPSLSHTNNDSNIVINKYERTMFSITVRRDFN